MRNIARMLVTGGLAMSLLLTGCNQGNTGTPTDSSDTSEQVTATEPAPEGGGGSGASASETPDATIGALDGWWKVTAYKVDAADASSLDEETLDFYADVFHSPNLVKVNSDEKTYEMGAFSIAMIGTVDDAPVDGWFVLSADSGTGLYDFMKSAKCRIEENSDLTIEVTGENGVCTYTCAKDKELADKPTTDSLFQYKFDVYMEYRNANENLPINWYDTPQVLAEDNACKLFLWGVGETDTHYILMTGIANENPYPLLVANVVTGTKITANGSVSLEPNFGCYMFEHASSQEQVRVFDCPIYISKAAVNNNLASVSGTFDITTVAFAPHAKLNFNITL